MSLITFGYVDNLAHALLLAIDQPEASMGEIFNCGDDERLTIRQVAEIITDELDHDWELLSMPADLAVPAAAADDELPHHPPRDGHLQAARASSATATSSRRDRPCGARRDGWSTTRPSGAATKRPRCRTRSTTRAEDRLAEWWQAAIADPPDLGYDELPGYGKSYAGPGTRNVRPDTRI